MSPVFMWPECDLSRDHCSVDLSSVNCFWYEKSTLPDWSWRFEGWLLRRREKQTLLDQQCWFIMCSSPFIRYSEEMKQLLYLLKVFIGLNLDKGPIKKRLTSPLSSYFITLDENWISIGFTLIVLIVGKVGSAKSGSDVLTVSRSRVPDDFTQIWQSAMTDRGRSVNMVECFWSKCGQSITRKTPPASRQLSCKKF